MIEDNIKPMEVYIDLDDNLSIVKIYSSYFETPKETSIKIDEGFGDKYKHCQNNYLEKSVYIEGKPRYLFKNNKIIERPIDEIRELYSFKEVPTETQLDRIEKRIINIENNNKQLTIDEYTLELLERGALK